MSAGSYDESSNLVPGLVSPPSGGKDDDVFDKIDQDLSAQSPEDFPELKEKTKKSKGLKQLLKPANKKRSKSPLRAILKSPLKSPSKSRAKAHATSPSEENLFRKFTEEPSENGEKEKEKSEEWEAFQQMQDRIKETVVKTQSTLQKLASQDEVPKRKKGADGRWVDFHDEQLIPDQQGIGGEEIASYEDNLSFSENIRNIIDLTESPACSPKISPKPPVNSLRNSVENLVSSQTEEMSGQGQYADLLGLSDDVGAGLNSSTNIVNEDLLGLDDLMSSTPPQNVPSGGATTSDWMMDSSPHVQQSSYCDSPVTFEQELLGGCDQQVPEASSGFVDPLMEEFLHDAAAEQAKAEKAKSNLIDDFLNDNVPEKTNVASILSDEYLMSKETTRNDDDDPFVVKLDTSTSEQITVESDDPFAVTSAVIPPSDELETKVISVQPKKVADDDFDPFATIIGDDSFIDPSRHAPKVQIITTDDDLKTNEPTDFMEQSSDVYGFPDKMTSSSPNPFADAVDNKFSMFDEEFFENIPEESGLVNKDSTWGGMVSDNTASTHSANPFQEDFFSADQIPVEPTDDVTTKNPFLTDNLDPVAVNQNLFLSIDRGSKLFEVSDTGDLDNTSFDPFNTSHLVEQKVVVEGTGSSDIFTSIAKSGDNQLVQPGEDDADDDSFMIEIKPKQNISSFGAPPALPPPPSVSQTASKGSRENPFDKESPPEEDFAKFPVPDEEEGDKHAPPVHSRSFSTDTSVSEEEESSLPLPRFLPDFEKDGWKLMIRYPTKKKIASNRHWKTVFIKIVKQKDGVMIKLYHDENERDTFQELLLQPCYSLSEMALQQYDQFGKIHTIKIQYVFYRERVGIRPERITPSFVRKPKPTMILDHAPQVSELLKFGCLDRYELQTFVYELENSLFHMQSHREKTLSYTKDEVTVEVWDEYVANIDKEGHILMQKARVRVFILAFVTGMPLCELGLNDRRRKGKEVVGRHDIIPVKTEEWIKLQNVEFHCSVNIDEFEKTNNIKFRPLDACQFELLRFPCRPKENKELPLQLSIQQILRGRHFEVRCDLLVTGYHAYSKKHGQYPCEDIEIQIKIPEPWIYLFRYERRFGYGSIKSAFRKPGKIKGLERLTMLTQGLLPPTLMEASVGTAKYEHVYKSVVWRVSKLPERNQGAYTNHLFILKLDLGQHDEIPTSFDECAHVYFTMPATSVSKCQARSISVDHPNPPEKWVRYLAKYEYKVDVDTIIQSGDSVEEDNSD